MPNTYTHVTQHIYGNISVPYICWTTLLDDILGPIYLLGNTIYMLGNTVPQHIYRFSNIYMMSEMSSNIYPGISVGRHVNSETSVYMLGNITIYVGQQAIYVG